MGARVKIAVLIAGAAALGNGHTQAEGYGGGGPIAFICTKLDTRTKPVTVTVDKDARIFTFEFSTENTSLPCIIRWKDGYYGPSFVGDYPGYCSMVYLGNESRYQSVEIDSNGATARAYDNDGNRYVMTLDFNSGILKSTAGFRAECGRAHL